MRKQPPNGTKPTRRRRRDHELEAGARAHFDDPAYYTVTYASRVDDVEFYLELARKHGRVLEYGIGNGRIALPMARAGVEVTGIDHSKAMLGDLRALVAHEPRDVRTRVRARAGDMRRVRLGRRFPLVICPFNTALHLYTRVDVEDWLARVHEHLEPGGELVFDVSMPILEDLIRNPATPYRMPPFVHPTAGKVKYWENFDYDRVRQVLFVSMWFEPMRATTAQSDRAANANANANASTEEDGFMTPLAHRQFFPCELEALLHYNGFEVTALHGDFEGGPLTAASEVMVWHARPARTRAQKATRRRRGT